ncbi:MAG: hypothetical protein L0027_05500 [Candidatus Rokubacteria bacterium]|nr:hypothetical protein [Candidatus Rokubacteria bacterium]
MSAHARSGSRVLLFSGHMIDAPGREAPRFPAALEPAASRAIEVELDRLAVGPADVAISSAACGGDILFAEAVLTRGVPTRIYLPLEEAAFLERSVAFANARWPERYRAVLSRSERLVAPEVLGPLAPDADPFERLNRWMLDEARRLGGAKVILISLWNGEGGDGPGGTTHMMDAVRAEGGAVVWIDIRRV